MIEVAALSTPEGDLGSVRRAFNVKELRGLIC